MSNYEKLAEYYAIYHCGHEDSSVQYLLNEKIEAAFIAGYLSATKWISIDYACPENIDCVLAIIQGYSSPTLASYYDGRFRAVRCIAPPHTIECIDYDPIVTHWMPLPEKP